MRGVGDTILGVQSTEGEETERWSGVYVNLIPLGTKDEANLRNLQIAAATLGRRIAIRPSPIVEGATRVSLVVGVCALPPREGADIG